MGIGLLEIFFILVMLLPAMFLIWLVYTYLKIQETRNEILTEIRDALKMRNPKYE